MVLVLWLMRASAYRLISRIARLSLIGSLRAALSSAGTGASRTPDSSRREIGSGAKKAQTCRSWSAAGWLRRSRSSDTFHAAATVSG